MELLSYVFSVNLGSLLIAVLASKSLTLFQVEFSGVHFSAIVFDMLNFLHFRILLLVAPVFIITKKLTPVIIVSDFFSLQLI